MATVSVDTTSLPKKDVTPRISALGDESPGSEKPDVADTVKSSDDIPPLGHPEDEKRHWWQRTRGYDGSAIATLPSVFDNPAIAGQYQPRSDWENLHRLNPLARWTWNEENKLIRKIDLRIMVFACVMYMALELDRANISQALADNFLDDLNLTTDDYNLGNTVFKLSFLCAELPSQLISKYFGPDRWIPTQIVAWSVVSASQFWLSGRTSFLICRCLIAVFQGGFLPDIIVYLSYFYKHHELSLRLGFLYTGMAIADIFAGFLAAGLLTMRGLHGQAGWRWMFMIEGLITLVVGLFAFGLMPASPTQTASRFRGKNGWFTEREETVMINRVIRDDPSKGGMHNRQPITFRFLWESLKDYDLWPLYMIGAVSTIPYQPPQLYQTLTLRNIGFNTLQTNLLSIPPLVFHIITMMGLTYLSEVIQQIALVCIITQIWTLPFLIYLYLYDITAIDSWVAWGVLTLLLSVPWAHPIQIGWNSRNSNSVRSRAVSAALYNMFSQAASIIASNIYRSDDAPRYRRGNQNLIGIACGNIVLYLLTKAYYIWRNQSREKKWGAMTDQEKSDYLELNKDAGNKRLDFRFAH